VLDVGVLMPAMAHRIRARVAAQVFMRFEHMFNLRYATPAAAARKARTGKSWRNL
jgi:hypothetical protein